VLALVIIQTARSYTLVFEAVDPYYNLFNIWTDEISITGYISVAVVLGASLFLERPFCRYACPLGALNGLFNSISFLNIKRNEESCIDCGACDRACPVNINVSKADLVNDNSCIRCMKCVDSCPVNIKTDTLNIKTSSLLANRNPKLVKAFSFGLIVMLVFASPIAVTIGMGNFMTEEERIFSSADDIRGSYTLGEIFANYEIDRETFFRAFGTSELADNIPVKNLEDISGTTVESVRKVVGGLNQPLNSIITELPENIDGEQSVRNYILSNETGSINQILQAEELKVVTDEGEEIEIKRKTMLIEIKDMVKDFEDFKAHFAIPDDMTLNTQLRTLISEYGLDIEEIKAYITENRNE
jgi:ferredoxin